VHNARTGPGTLANYSCGAEEQTANHILASCSLTTL